MLAAVSLLAAKNGIWNRFPPVVMGLGIDLFMAALTVSALVLFNRWWANPLGLMTQEELLRRLEEDGLLISEDYQAQRAFVVGDYNDEGPHYFVELADGRVLYLVGQYLYDFEPDDECEPDEARPRLFPTTDFTLRTHTIEGYVVEIERRGEVIEPEFVVPPLPTQRWRALGFPLYGQVVTDRPFDELKELIRTQTSR